MFLFVQFVASSLHFSFRYSHSSLSEMASCLIYYPPFILHGCCSHCNLAFSFGIILSILCQTMARASFPNNKLWNFYILIVSEALLVCNAANSTILYYVLFLVSWDWTSPYEIHAVCLLTVSLSLTLPPLDSGITIYCLEWSDPQVRMNAISHQHMVWLFLI
jgi:hypothetical protein